MKIANAIMRSQRDAHTIKELPTLSDERVTGDYSVKARPWPGGDREHYGDGTPAALRRARNGSLRILFAPVAHHIHC